MSDTASSSSTPSPQSPFGRQAVVRLKVQNVAERDLIGVPITDEDWERMKPAIEDLYINKSLALRDVDEMMRSSYQFKATPRMYKRRFAKWNWHKYNKPQKSKTFTSQGQLASRGSRSKKSSVVWANAKNKRQVLPKFLLENAESHELSIILFTYRDYIRGWAEQDPRSHPNSPFHKTEGYDHSMVSQFLLSFNYIRNKEHRLGGRALRTAFIQLEDLVIDGHLHAIWDCCITIPYLAYEFQLKDVLMAFLGYLHGLSAIRAKDHPFNAISRALLKYALSNFDHLSQYTRSSYTLWKDILISIVGLDNINTLNLKRAFIAMQKQPTLTDIEDLVADYDRLSHKAATTIDDRGLTSLTLDFDNLSIRLRYNVPGSLADYQARAESILARLAAYYDPYGGPPPEGWSTHHRNVYRGCWSHLEQVAVAGGDMRRAAECRARFLAGPTDGDWVQFAWRMEERLKQRGHADLAALVEARRLEVQVPKNIAKILEAEEKELPNDPNLRITNPGGTSE